MKIKRNGFIVIKQLNTINENGNIRSENYDLNKIEKELGDVVIDRELTKVQVDNANIYLVLHCQEKEVKGKPKDLSKYGFA